MFHLIKFMVYLSMGATMASADVLFTEDWQFWAIIGFVGLLELLCRWESK